MPITLNDKSAIVGAQAENVQFAPEANAIPSKCFIVATYDEVNKTDIVQNTLYRILSPEHAGDLFGFGFGPNYLARWLWKGHGGLETWVIPVDQDAGAAAATGTLTLIAATTSAGSIFLYIAGELAQVAIAKGLDETTSADQVTLAVNANTDLPVTAGNVAGVITFTAKDLNLGTDDITISLNEKLGEETAAGITGAAIVAMSAGAGVMDSDMATALAALGTNDDQNEGAFTHFTHGFGITAAVLDDLSEYNGEGDQNAGNWEDTVHKPFWGFAGDVDAGGSGLTAIAAIGNGRKLDRTNGAISAPGSPNHPDALAAVANGVMARVQQDVAAQTMIGEVLPGILPGVTADRWNNTQTNRNTANAAGVSPTLVKSGAVFLINVLSFYHPDNVPDNNNGYKSFISQSPLRNMTKSVFDNFNGSRWQGTIIVADKNVVSDPAGIQVTRDRGDAVSDVLALVDLWGAKPWIYTPSFTKDRISSDPLLVVIRPAADGFTITIPVILPGEGNVFDNKIQFDKSLTILTQ